MNPATDKKWPHSQMGSKVERKHGKIFGNHLHDLGGGIGGGRRSGSRSENGSSGWSSSSELSTSVSIEAPNGRLRSCFSHSSSANNIVKPVKSVSSTPISAAEVLGAKPSCKSKLGVAKSKRSFSEKPFVQKPLRCKKNPPPVHPWQSVKKPSSRVAANLCKLQSGSGELKQDEENFKGDEKNELFTPVTKFSAGSGLDHGIVTEKVVVDERSNPSSCDIKTPPVEPSVSPEIQCGSSMVSTTGKTPACYAAGYIFSDVSDKRKCKPRGTLTVYDKGDSGFVKPLALNDSVDSDERTDDVNASTVSIVPFPVDASVHWLLSPCDEDKEAEKASSEDGSCELHLDPGSDGDDSASDSPDHGLSPDICITSSGRRVTVYNGGNNTKGKTRSPSESVELRGFTGFLNDNDALVSFSPFGTAGFECILSDKSKQKRTSPCKLGFENSPASIDTLGSENVIQTPHSDSSSDKHVGFSRFQAEDHKIHSFDSDLGSMITTFRKASLSPKSPKSMLDPAGSGFGFDSLPVPPDSVDLYGFQRGGSDRDSCLSSLALGNFSQSQLQISWKDGLENQIFEAEEFDHCRCLSDEEDNLSSLSNEQFIESIQKKSINASAGNTHFLHEEPIPKNRETLPSKVSYSCAESISTEGGSLVSSEDSDWAACYKNQFFDQ